MLFNKYKIIKTSFIFIIVLTFVLFIYLRFSKRTNYNNLLSKYDFNEIEMLDGDIIFRRGLSLSSHAVLISDKNSRFSHVGIIRVINEIKYVVHAVPGESENEVEYLKMEPIQNFLNKEKANLAAVYRLKNYDKKKISILAEEVEGFAKKKLIFDNQYNLESDDQLYCTELIWKAYKSIGIDLTNGKRNKLKIPIGPTEIILPSLIQECSLIEEIYFFN